MTDEDKLIDLLQRHQAGDHSVEGDILELLDTYFRRELTRVIAKGFGKNVVGSPRHEGQCRYTDMVNDFFVKILETRPDSIWKAQTAHDLRSWTSKVIRNQMIDALRRMKRGEQILEDVRSLIEQRRAYFQERYRTTLEEFLDQISTWEASQDESLILKAAVLRHRYIDGMKWQDIAAQLGTNDEALTKIRKQVGADFGGYAR